MANTKESLMDKPTVMFYFARFLNDVERIPSFPFLKREMVYLASKVAKHLRDEYFGTLDANYAKMVASGDLLNSLTSVKKSFEAIQKTFIGLDASEFIPRKGIDNSNRVITLFGVEQTVLEHVGEMLKGSSILSFLTEGIPNANTLSDGDWAGLASVTNMIASSVRDLIPADKRRKNEKKVPVITESDDDDDDDDSNEDESESANSSDDD